MILRSTVLYALSQGLPALIAFGSLSVFTRLIDPTAYGRYTVVFTVAMAFSTLLFGWMRAGILRFTSGLGHRRSLIFTTCLYCFTPIAAVVVIAGIGYDALIGTRFYGFSASMVALCVVSYGAWQLCMTFVQTGMFGGRHLWINLTRIISQVAISLLLVVYLEWQGLALMTGLIVGQALSAILALGAHRVEILSGRWSRISADRLWRFGWPTCIKTVTAFVEAYLDRLLLIALVDAAAAGIYGVSYDLLSRSLTLLTGAVSMAGMPLVVRAISEGGLHAAYKRLSSYFTLLLGITMPASFGLLLLNKNLCVVLVGEMYRDGVIMVLPLVALATVLRMIREFYSDFAFEAIRQPKKQLPVYYATATASVALNLILIPLYGLKGAAIAMVVAQLFGLALSWILIRRLFPLPFPRLNTLKITLASVAMSTALWPTLPHVGWQVLIGQVVLGAGVYILALYVLDLNGMRRRFRWNTVLDTLFPVPVPHPLPSETEPPGNIL